MVLRVALVRVINLVQNHAHKVVLYPTHRLVHTAARPHLVPNIMVVRAMHLIQATVQSQDGHVMLNIIIHPVVAVPVRV